VSDLFVQQVQSTFKYGGYHYKNTFDAVATISRTEGLRGIYRGYGATVMSFGPYSAFYLMFYEQFIKLNLKYYRSREAKQIQKEDLPFTSFLLSGAVAGGMASFLTNPLDMAKLRIQVERARMAAAVSSGASPPAGFFNYPNIFKGMSSIVANEGWVGLFKGVGARICFASPAAALSLTLYEELKVFYFKFLQK
jgi:hypothetical protein